MAKKTTDLDNGATGSGKRNPILTPILVFLIGTGLLTTFGFFGQEIRCSMGHQYTNWWTQSAPACEINGEERRQCEVCGHTESRSLEALEHKYVASVWEPTCVEEGRTRHTCEICGDWYVDSYVDAIGHNYENEVCKNCGDSDYWTFKLVDGQYHISVKDKEKLPSQVILPSSCMGIPVTSIASSAFSNCESLTRVTLPDTINSIGECAFMGCTGLTDIIIPDGVTIIGDSAFEGCTGLTDIIIPDGVEHIGDYAFKGCVGVAEIVIPDSVTHIGEYAFEGCSSLTSIEIPDSVTSIDQYTFSDCSSLTSIVIPNSVTSIGTAAFYDCTGLTDVYYSGTMKEWAAIAIDSDNSTLTNSIVHYNFGAPTLELIDRIILDGDLSDWDDALCKPVRFDQNNLEAWIGEVGDDDGFTARITADDEFVYFAFDNTDYEVFFSDDGQYNADAFQIQMDFNGWCGASDEFDRAIFYSFGLQEDGTIDITVQCRDTDAESAVDYTMASDDEAEWREGHVKGATKKKADGSGWIAEFAISWETLYRDVSQKFATIGEEVPAVNVGYEDVYINMLITYLDHEPDAYDSHSITGAWGTSNQSGALGSGDGWLPENAGVKACFIPALGQGFIEFN